MSSRRGTSTHYEPAAIIERPVDGFRRAGALLPPNERGGIRTPFVVTGRKQSEILFREITRIKISVPVRYVVILQRCP